MIDYKNVLLNLNKNLNILREREAKHAGNAPVELINQINDHQQAIALTEQALRGEISEVDRRKRFKPLLVSLKEAQAIIDQRNQQVGTQINVAGDYHAGPPSPTTLDADTALASYLRHVIEANRCLQLQGIRSSGELVRIELEQVYITLTATERRTVTVEATWLEEMAHLAPGEAKRLTRPGPEQPRETVAQVTVKVQKALADHLRLVVLGDPGCGKTTLLRYLALTFARDLGGETGLVTQRLDLAEPRLPILLPLRDFARHLETQHPDFGLDGPKVLLDYLRAYFANQDIALPERFFADRLQNGQCAVLLDGVDEVASLPTRHRIARIIERFTIAYPNNRYVVTSRIVGYIGPARLAADYALTTVRDFTQADIVQFLSYWNLAVEIVLAKEDTPFVRQQAVRRTASLAQSIQNNERVRELAVNPLLLTVIALVQRYRAQLPERRTELYEEAIEVLLGQWDVAKGLTDKSLVAGRELDAGDRRSLLEPVALWMMEQQAREIELTELRQQLAGQFSRMVTYERQVGKAVDEFVRLINERSGLLIERGQGVYAFSHLTFQEHLAARAVADREDYIAYTLARLGDSWWREVVLLETGYLSTQGKRRVTLLLQAIMDYQEEPVPYHNLTLAAECLRDVGAARIEGDLWSEVQRRLHYEFELPLPRRSMAPQALLVEDLIRRRAAAAEALARIETGGSGAQPAFWRLPYGEPVWVEIPAGKFWLGDGAEQQKFFLPVYQISRVPITNAQYFLFAQATKHPQPRHWEDARPPRGQESHPVVNVTWQDALAYCRWLAQVTGLPITLPTETQWEKAARGTDGRVYPWGNQWHETKCNTAELELNQTTPVGIFPNGASPYDCLDMAGNVWEWTRSLWGMWQNGKAVFKFDYPYNPTDGRENLEAGEKYIRVLRGGSWGNFQYFARCAYRFTRQRIPIVRNYSVGFRAVISPISP